MAFAYHGRNEAGQQESASVPGSGRERVTGVEPATSTLARLRSSQLSYTRIPERALPNGPSRSEQPPRWVGVDLNPRAGSLGEDTERVGFEPTVPLSGYTRFPVAPIRPLWHLSQDARDAAAQRNFDAQRQISRTLVRERRGWDSNPRDPFGAYTISSRAPSTGLGHLSRSR